MDPQIPYQPCTDTFEPTLFIRHHRMLRAITLDAQAWFPLIDIARLMGIRLCERSTLKLDADQRRMAWLLTSGHWEKCLMISESGVYALLIHHYIPENRALRRWLAQDVLPALDAERSKTGPASVEMRWQGGVMNALRWRGELWLKMRDLPELVQVQGETIRGSFWARLVGGLLR
jgi:prophage antirepressor-like protein